MKRINSHLLAPLDKVFFKKELEDISPFCGAADTPVLDFR